MGYDGAPPSHGCPQAKILLASMEEFIAYEGLGGLSRSGKAYWELSRSSKAYPALLVLGGCKFGGWGPRCGRSMRLRQLTFVVKYGFQSLMVA